MYLNLIKLLQITMVGMIYEDEIGFEERVASPLPTSESSDDDDSVVIEGIPDHRDLVLTESEQKANRTMMICCSGCKGDRLVLDI